MVRFWSYCKYEHSLQGGTKFSLWVLSGEGMQEIGKHNFLKQDSCLTKHCKELCPCWKAAALSHNMSRTRAGPVISLPVWDRQMFWPLTMLWSSYESLLVINVCSSNSSTIYCHFFNLYAELFIFSLWFRVKSGKLSYLVHLLEDFIVNVFIKWNDCLHVRLIYRCFQHNSAQYKALQQ